MSAMLPRCRELRVEEEVASGCPPREGPGGARFDDASSRHARRRSEKRAAKPSPISSTIRYEPTLQGVAVRRRWPTAAMS